MLVLLKNTEAAHPSQWFLNIEMVKCSIATGVIFNLLLTTFTLMQFKWIMSWRDRNIKWILMSGTYHCNLRQILILAEQKKHCTHSVGPTLQRSTSSAGCIFNMLYFDFETALTEGYFWLIVKALYHVDSKHYLSIHLPCLSLTFSQPRVCIDNPFPLFFLHPVLTLQRQSQLFHIYAYYTQL